MKARVKATGKIVEVKYSRQMGPDAVYRDLVTGEHYMDFELSFLPEDGTHMLNAGLQLDSKLYPEVTFENSPMEVELVIKK